jgi:signal transduction histidine kinase
LHLIINGVHLTLDLKEDHNLMNLVFTRIYSLLFFLYIGSNAIVFAQTTQENFDQYIAKSKELRFENFDSALYYITKAEAIALSSQDKSMMLQVLGQKGGIYYIGGKYDQSLIHYIGANELAVQLGDKSGLANALNGRGLISMAQHEYQEAIGLFEEALQLNEAIGDQENIARNLFNLGICLADIGAYEASLERLLAGEQLAATLRDKTLYTMIVNRLGRVHYELEQYDAARRYYQMLMAEEKNMSNWEKTFLYSGLAELDFQEGRYSDAVSNGELGLDIAMEMGVFWDIQRASAVLSKSYEALENHELALQFSRLNKRYSDSLYNKEKNQEISFLRLQLAQAENESLQQEKEVFNQKAKFNNYLIFGLVILVILMFWLLFSYRRNMKLQAEFGASLKIINQELEVQKELTANQNDQLKEMNSAKNKIFSILTHDLKSPIHTLKQFLELHSQGMLDEADLQKAFTLLYMQVDKTERMMENLLHWSKGQMEGINLNPEVIALSPFMEEVMGNFEQQCSIKDIRTDFQKDIHFDKVIFDRGQLMIVLQNIFNNAIKFSPRGGEIKVFFSKHKKFLNLHIKDEGEGMGEKRRLQLEKAESFVDSSLGSDKEVGTGLGLLLVKQFMCMNDGNVSIKSQPGEGTEVVLGFVVPEATGQSGLPSRAKLQKGFDS